MSATVTDLLLRSADARPDHPAVVGPYDTYSYARLDEEASRVAAGLLELGVRRGDRVCVWMEKSCRAVAALQGVLRAGAVYVPLDVSQPAARAARVLDDCDVKVLIASPERAARADPRGLRRKLSTAPAAGDLAWSDLDGLRPAERVPYPRRSEDLAYILYTSGSTGRPKGVAVHHGAARAFIDWATSTLDLSPNDRLSGHAPFHFDLSVLDLYGAFAAGASVYLISEASAYLAPQLARFLDEQQLTVWYSVPSALILMMTQADLLEPGPSSLRVIAFAGEPFPLPSLRKIAHRFPRARLLNLYGPTETNVCTWHEVTEDDLASDAALPIGRAAAGDRVWAVDEEGAEVGPGETGELLVAGPTVMSGYWGHPPQGQAPYRTGDQVRVLEQQRFVYLGRRDQMVKVRGHRVELAEVEDALADLPGVAEALALVVGKGLSAKLVAALVPRAQAAAPSLLRVKQHCATRLPRPMLPDAVVSLPSLPRTANGKRDRPKATALAEQILTSSKETSHEAR